MEKGSPIMLMQRIILVVLVLNTLVVAASAYLSYSLLNQSSGAPAVANLAGLTPSPKPAKAEEYKFFAIQKIIVSLPGEGREHYFVLDLVLQANLDTDDKKLQQIDPMVRNSVVAHLSSLSVNQLRSLPITELQAKLEEVVLADFASRQVVQPFVHVLVSKLVVQ